MRILSFVFITFLFFSCTKNKLGGNSFIKGRVKHHEKIITKASVFIKFNAKEFPGADTTKYDAKVRVDAVGNYLIKCYKGDYFLYAFGFDYGIDPPYYVKGGLSAHLRNNETTELDLGVTE